MHEIAHALGFAHEHQNPKSESKSRKNWHNIPAGEYIL